MPKNIVIIQGHPDPAGNHFCHALAQSYANGAKQVGHLVRTIEVAGLNFPLLRTQEDFEQGDVPGDIRESQQAIRPIRETLISRVDLLSQENREKWLAKLRALGTTGF